MIGGHKIKSVKAVHAMSSVEEEIFKHWTHRYVGLGQKGNFDPYA